MEVVRRHFRPEFLNRVDEIVVFHRLTVETAQPRSSTSRWSVLRRRLADRRLDLDLTPAARAWLAEHGYDPTYGARPLKRLIRKEIEDPPRDRPPRGPVRRRGHGAGHGGERGAGHPVGRPAARCPPSAVRCPRITDTRHPTPDPAPARRLPVASFQLPAREASTRTVSLMAQSSSLPNHPTPDARHPQDGCQSPVSSCQPEKHRPEPSRSWLKAHRSQTTRRPTPDTRKTVASHQFPVASQRRIRKTGGGRR